MEPVRWGIIGLGFFGEKHAEVLSDMLGVELAGVCTRRSDRLAEIAKRFSVPRTYRNYEDLLADPKINAVSLVTHVDDHRDMALRALAAGKHVFLEKPMAPTAADCDAILTAARQARGLFMVGHICRFDPRVSVAKSAIAEGRIGKIVSLHATRNLPAHISESVLNKISPLMGDGLHDTDLMLWFTGSAVKTAYAQNVRVRNLRHPDIGWAMYRFASGAVGVIEVVWHLPQNAPFTIDARMEIVGDKGALYIDCGQAGVTINDAAGVHRPDTAYWPELNGRRVGALRYELEYFAECIRQKRRPEVVTAEEARTAVAAVCAAEASAASGTVVSL